MAKKAKIAKEVPVPTEAAAKLPPIEQGLVTVAFTNEELAALANLMSICAQTFERLAVQAVEQADNTSYAVLSARYKLSSIYANKLASASRIGEPASRDIH